MATKYADRAFISINGTTIADVQSASLKQNLNAKEVPSMTKDGWNKGFVMGNRTIDISLSIAMQNQLSRPKLENIDFENNDVQLTFLVGSEKFIATGLFMKDVDDNAGGVGEEVKTSFNMSALKLTDAIGNSALFSIEL